MKNNSKFSLNKLAAALSIGVVTAVGVIPTQAEAQVTFRNAISGEVIDFSFGKKGEETEAVKHFKSTAENLYNGDEEAIKMGEDLFATACSGCHGHNLEGKLGPALGDDYWTYTQGRTDKGIFEIMYDGARSMMGPQRNNLSIDEMLHVMAFIRSSYWGKPENALWIPEEQRAEFEPAEMPEEFKEAMEEFNKRNK
ncbi:cytochrome c, class I [Methylophaga frappieri]|jgi:cytochrome c-L|uniref:Cytochrome c, class I n=1 Tax=Methylophaga frappieri (strain ATCC BAA-2434 / DSM 25690 / JAM7) TaxID=754477 RepID=I1YK16_METFJ|nr:cytochrome c(L), periplasmic [Methylophaga frappieri]AFJ03259.1 cytochrome c, class I [Methylophaga frappieri]